MRRVSKECDKKGARGDVQAVPYKLMFDHAILSLF